VSEGRRKRQLPDDVVGEQRLPARGVGDQRLDVAVQEVLGVRHAGDPGLRRIVIRSWAGHVTSRSVSGTPGRTTRARNLFAPCMAVG
jgi:hypothetical protein